MKTRNLISTCVLGLLLFSASTVLADRAQGPGTGGGRNGPGNQGMQERNQPPALPDSNQVAQMVDEVAESLDLSADQKEQVSVLYFAHFAEARAEMSDISGDRDDHRDKMAALRREFEGDVKALLTDEQQAEFDELAKKRRPQGGRTPR